MSEWKALSTVIRQGFAAIQVSPELKDKAVRNLERWFTDPALGDAGPQLKYLVESGNFPALFDAFFQQIPFGTGGRRGAVGFGPNRMNPQTVATSAQGHAEFLKRHSPPGKEIHLVIAFDVRVFRNLRGVYDPDRPNPLLEITSRDFARIAARVYAANGIGVWFPPPDSTRFLSTPELSFTIRFLEARGGLNVSASHNHPDDNGAKIYNAHGSQEIPPLDQEIAEIVDATDSAQTTGWEEAVRDGQIRWIPPETHDAYIEANLQASLDPEARSARIAFTPLHGTGGDSVGTTLKRAGFELHTVPSQETPDGTFPNVPFRSPNPEIPESLEAATELARSIGADVVFGSDPDADRLGMVAPDADGVWHFIGGNELGVLLTAYILSRIDARRGGGKRFAATTVVTTSLFRKITEAHGVQTVSHLPVGFKYIAAVMNGIETEGVSGEIRASIADFVIGFEESFGYLVVPGIRDKDAAGAALLLAELVSNLKEEGRTLFDYLDAIHRKHGYVRNLLRSTVMRGTQGFLNIRRIQQSLRESPPDRIGGLRVVRFIDRWQESGPLGKFLSETDRAARDLLIFELEEDARVILRPSGTESKNKIYVEACGKPLGEHSEAAALARQKEQVDALARRLAGDFTREMLERIEVRLPPYALEVSDLVPLESKRDFAESFLPELLSRLDRGETGTDLEAWIDGRLKPYGADGRLLVRKAIDCFCREESSSAENRGRLGALFGLTRKGSPPSMPPSRRP